MSAIAAQSGETCYPSLVRGLFLVLLLGCDAPSTVDGVDATATDAADEAEDGDLVLADSDWVPVELDVLVPAPSFACAVDAGVDASVCPLPRSVCVGEQLLEYFDDGRCVDSGCSFRVNVHQCYPYGRTCVDGGCVLPNLTQVH